MKAFRALKHYRLPPGSRLCLMDDGLPLKVSPEDPAIHCMTDLHRVPAVTTKASALLNSVQKLPELGGKQIPS